MNLDSLSFALYNISYSVANLTKKNFKSSVQEISRLVTFHGLEAERHLIRCLFSHVDFSGDGKSSGKDFHQTQYLIQECSVLPNKYHFVSTVCYAIDCPLQQQKSLKPSPQLLPQLSKVLKFSNFQEVAFGLALLHSSSEELKQHAFSFLKEKLPHFLKICDSDLESGKEHCFSDLSVVALQFLQEQIHIRYKEFDISEKQKDSFFETVKKVKSTGLISVREDIADIEANLKVEDIAKIMESNVVCGNSMNTNSSEDAVVDRIRDIGYAFTSSLDDCRNNSAQMGFREPTPSIVARILSMMARTHTGMTDSISAQSMNSNVILWNESKEKSEGNQPQSWNVEIFVQVLHEMLPNLDWKETVHELDHPNFLLTDRQGLKLLWQALIMGLGHEPFPMDLMYRRWRNAEGQFSFFQQVLNCPDVVCLTDYNHRPVTIDALKAPPEEDNRSISNWKSLDLIETLLSLSETPYFKDEVFKFPVQQCPDLLVLGLIQTSRAMNQFHKDVLSRLIPIFLNNHPNSAIVLHLAWHSQVHTTSVKNIIMHAMADWYVRGDYDQTRLSRILDVAQDLKALSMLLNVTPFMFVIDLACLASRREYLKLDKWLLDKIREHGEGFVQACVNFMRRRCPQIVGGGVKEESLPKSALPPETLAVICHVLQSLVGSVSQDLSETILTLVNSCSLVWNSSRGTALPGSIKSSRGLESVLSSATVNTPNTALDSLGAGLSSSVAGLSLGPNIKTNLSGSSVFPVPRDLHPFTTASLGSPIKMLSVATPTTSVSSVSQINQNFSSLQSNTTQMPSHFSSQLVGDISSIFSEVNHPVAKEIEDEANSYFQRIYNHPPHPTLTIDEVLDMLKRFQDSPNQREKDVFNCMIRNLLEEYRFFPVYPEKELLITAQLFGGIIEHNLVNYLTLGIALRYVLDAIKKGENSKMFYFGVAAMERFKKRLKEYPQYCQYLTTISTFQDLPLHLVEYIEYGARSQEPPRVQGAAAIPSSLSAIASGFSSLSVSANTIMPITTTAAVAPSVTSSATKSTVTGKPSIANATNIDTLLGATEKDEKIVVPPEAVQDKVAFIVNNLSQANLAQKTEEFKEILKEEYWPWASQYLVMKRASIEPNFHSLYSNFLDTLKHGDLTKLVIQETFRNIKVLLRSDKVIANFSDRSLLKNLGHWLGILTIAKSKPILQIEIDMKSLLIEAYHNGVEELLYVVPFIAKVLESCAKSKVFKPPNPWTMGIMNALSELHKEQDLKLNLKFEIEVLCKTLSLDINDLKPGNVLKDPERAIRLEPQLSPLPKPKEQNIAAVSLPGMQQKPLGNVISQPQNPLPITGGPLPTDENPNTVVSVSGSSPPSVMVVPQATQVPASMPQPQFSYNDINIMTIGGLTPHILINSQLSLFQAHAQLKQCVRPAVERAVQEWIIPVVERSVKIALTTCENIIKKDFALDPEESRMRLSAHHMIRYLTAGMAMITCKDPLLISITNNLKQAFLSAGASQQQKDMVEQAAQVVAQDNVELACCFIQKTAVEKALPEIDKRLSNEFELRKIARSEGRRYCDGNILTYQAERIPEQIRLKVGSVTPQQMAVYEEFNRAIPGFIPNNDPTQAGFGKVPLPVAIQTFGTDEVTQTYDKLASDLDHLARTGIQPNSSNSNSLHISALHSLVDAVHLARNSRDIVSALALVQKATEALLEVIGHISADHEIGIRFRDGHLLVLKVLADQRMYGLQWTSKQVTRYLIESREECRYNLEAVDLLIRSRLIDMPTYDLHLTQLMEKGNYLAVTFAMQLVKLYLIDDRQSAFVTESDLMNTIETLARLASVPRQGPEGLSQLLDVLRSNNDASFLDRATSAGPSMMMHTGINQAREFDDPPGLYEKTEFLLREWVSMYHSPNSGRDSTKAFSLFVHQMNLQGILKTDELITRFFRISTEMCVDHCYQNLMNQAISSPTLVRTKCFHTIDAFVRLIALLVKHSGDSSNTLTKLNLLNKVLGVMAGVLLQDQEVRGTEFQQLAYQRIFIMLYLELTAPDAVLEAINAQIIQAFANTLFFVRPYKAPGFSYAWLELISHRVFLGRMLAVAPQPKVHTPSGCPPVNSWGLYAQLLITLFKFLTPFLRNVELAQPIHLLYKGTLKVLLILLHDFPEFLCDYHYHFCDVIPPNCIQMRNLILSAFPRNMRLPDPFTPNLKVDLLADIKQQPRMVANLCSAIQPTSFKQDLDSYIKTRSPVTFLSELRSNLQNTTEPGMRYNIPLINALVLYVGTQAISYIQNKGNTPSMGTITHSSHMDIFQNLAVDLDTEGRYLFLNAIANQLRYPNSHTHYFSCTLLYLFAEANTEAIQEQITRVLLERLIVNRPHPWGLLITFIELIKNQTFKFWNHEFVRCAPEIEKLFESVARSCMHPKPAAEQASS